MLVIIYNSKEEWKEKRLQGTFFWKLNCVRVLCSYGHGNTDKEADKDREFLSWDPWDHSRVNLGYPPILSHLKKTFAAVAAVQSLNCVRLFVAPWTVTHQAPLSMGFSRQEYWRGLQFPSPMHESESESEVTQSCLTLSDPMDCSPPGSSIHGIFQARVLEWGAIAFSDS